MGLMPLHRENVNLFLWLIHTNGNLDLKDVKLSQVHTLLKGLEKIATSVDIHVLVCGDLNSIPASSPNALSAMGKVESSHPD